MARRRKGAVRKGHGSMCNICGRNCGKGGPLKTHIQGAHDVNYEDYKNAFYGRGVKVLADTWDDQVSTSKGKTVFVHVLVRRFVGQAGPRGVRKTAK